MEPQPAPALLADFADPGEAARWEAINDTVMGGHSRSQLDFVSNGSAVFWGDLSLQDGGGFASVAREPLEVRPAEAGLGVRLRVRGDGNRYQLRLKMSCHGWPGSYLAPFATLAGQWQELELRTADFVPRWRGRAQPQAPALQWSAVDGLGLLLSDQQLGAFRLELAWIAAF